MLHGGNRIVVANVSKSLSIARLAALPFRYKFERSNAAPIYHTITSVSFFIVPVAGVFVCCEPIAAGEHCHGIGGFFYSSCFGIPVE